MKTILKQIEKLEAVLELSKILNSTKDFKAILEILLKRSLELIDGADTGAIFIYNPNNGLLEPKVYVGFDPGIEAIRLKPGESITGHCFQTKQTYFIDSAKQLAEFIQNMSEVNQKIILEFKSKQFSLLKSSIVCPLIHKEEAIGVIVIDNYESIAPLTLDDVKLIESISVQATIALVNAAHFEQEVQNQATLKKVNALLKEEQSKVSASLELQNYFTTLALRNISLEDLLGKLSDRLKMDCLLIGSNQQLLAASTQLSKTQQETLMEKVHRQNCLKLQPSQLKLDQNKQIIRFLPILVNEEILGWLGSLSSSTKLDDIQALTLERAVIAFALELLKRNEMRLQEQSYKGDFLDRLLQNQNKTGLESAATGFGFTLEVPHQILLLGVDHEDLNLSEETQHRQFKSALDDVFQSLEPLIQTHFPGSVCLVKDNLITIILEYRHFSLSSPLTELITTLIQPLRTSKTGYVLTYGALGPLIQDFSNFAESFRQTHLTFKTAIKLEMMNLVLDYEALEIKRLLMKNTTLELEDFMNRIIGPLLTYEKQSGKEFLNTLRFYITSNSNWTLTKDQLHIHGNTLNYRLSRISEILQINLNDYHQRFKVQMAFEIMDLLALEDHHLQ